MKSSASHLEILEAMRHPYTGIGFLTIHQSFSNLTFVSADAVNWLIERMEGVTNVDTAVQVFFIETNSFFFKSFIKLIKSTYKYNFRTNIIYI